MRLCLISRGRDNNTRPTLKIVDGILCRDRPVRNTAQAKLQVIIPPDAYAVKQLLISHCHDAAMSGHLGYKRTLARLLDKYG